MSFEFDPHFRAKLIVLVGLGGTGSQWARAISRMAYDMERRRLERPQILFVDPDVIEEKNVGRQMFTTADIGKNKAEVLARRFNHALGLNIMYRPEPFNKTWFEADRRGERGDREGMLLCGAVDNHHARLEMSQVNSIWIDAGNHFATGQVIIGNTPSMKDVWDGIADAGKQAERPSTVFGKGHIRWLPTPGCVFPDLLKPPAGEPQVDASCADLVAMGDQHLLINDLIATVAAGYTFNLLYRQPIKSFVTYVDVLGLSMRSIPITRDDLEAYLPVEAAVIA